MCIVTSSVPSLVLATHRRLVWLAVVQQQWRGPSTGVQVWRGGGIHHAGCTLRAAAMSTTGQHMGSHRSTWGHAAARGHKAAHGEIQPPTPMPAAALGAAGWGGRRPRLTRIAPWTLALCCSTSPGQPDPGPFLTPTLLPCSVWHCPHTQGCSRSYPWFVLHSPSPLLQEKPSTPAGSHHLLRPCPLPTFTSPHLLWCAP